MNPMLSRIVARHQWYWLSNDGYRWSWFVWPQALSLLAVMLLLAPGGANRPWNYHWAKPIGGAAPGTSTAPTSQDPDYAVCVNPNADFKLRGQACERLIAANKLTGVELSFAYFGRGWMHQLQNLIDQSITDYSEAIKLNANNFAAFNNRGSAYLGKNDIASALEDFNKAIDLEPNNALGIANRAEVRRRQGRLQEALEDVNKALSIDGNLQIARTYEAAIQADLKKAGQGGGGTGTDTSGGSGTPPSTATGGDSDAARARAKAAAEAGRDDDAIAEFTTLINAGSTNPADYDGRGNAYNRKKMYDSAVADFTKAVSLDNHDWHSHTSLASILISRGSYDDALTQLNEAIDEDGAKDALAYGLRANAYWGKGQYRNAVYDYDKYVELRPDDPEAYFLRGRVESEDTRSTLEYCRNQDNSKSTLIGGTCSRPINYDAALADFNTAVAKKSGYADAHYEIGRIMLEQNKLDDAIKAFTAAIRANPNFSYALNNRGVTYFRKGMKELAFADYTQAIRADPNNTAALTNRGDIYSERGKRNDAIADYRKALSIDKNYTTAREGLERLGVKP